MRNYTTTEGNSDDYFDVTGPFSGYIVEKAALGYTVSYWSRVTGSRDGLRLLLGVDFDEHADMNLAAPWNEHMSRGEYIAAAARGNPAAVVLNQGEIVR